MDFQKTKEQLKELRNKKKELTEKITETEEYKERQEVLKNIKKIVNTLLGEEPKK